MRNAPDTNMQYVVTGSMCSNHAEPSVWVTYYVTLDNTINFQVNRSD